MAAEAKTNAGTKLHICATPKNTDLTETEFKALTFVQVKMVPFIKGNTSAANGDVTWFLGASRGVQFSSCTKPVRRAHHSCMRTTVAGPRFLLAQLGARCVRLLSRASFRAPQP